MLDGGLRVRDAVDKGEISIAIVCHRVQRPEYPSTNGASGAVLNFHTTARGPRWAAGLVAAAQKAFMRLVGASSSSRPPVMEDPLSARHPLSVLVDVSG